MFTPEVFIFIFLSVGALSLFGFLAVASYSEARRQERDSYYKNDMLKKIAESQSSSAIQTLEYLREQEQSAAMRRAQKKHEGYVLGGLINIAVGIGLMVFLHAVTRDNPVFYVGMIPGLVGAALLAYAYLLMPPNRGLPSTSR
ncbi:MAG TPA: DUF6249 domain-containing protein [Pseudacidobacterium sp.]|jgi:hypothetical protein|nr:DUF6249 domain-containing protein [Pseudacidobacterium sp.]